MLHSVTVSFFFDFLGIFEILGFESLLKKPKSSDFLFESLPFWKEIPERKKLESGLEYRWSLFPYISWRIVIICLSQFGPSSLS